ncbi:hypothetical protein ASD78_12085 [Lysobacter sp. Root667]|uniref:hypothetical protein n=1 Tax=Lysobacter sp. Root667 TaxID=1736581 RepID=UPI0006F5281A|nr:hypothetical protein [Lysobacter sp. Root667]KRA74227.1 hypothetical protein ASD78_12085 [Lysobacter sp. Root667]
MRDLPIPFSPEMVRAVLDGRKTQTRRLVRGGTWANEVTLGMFSPEPEAAAPEIYGGLFRNTSSLADQLVRCPFGGPGGRLWVREPWRVGAVHDGLAPRDILPRPDGRGVTVHYEAGGWMSTSSGDVSTAFGPMPDWAGKYRPAMFMPRWASRIGLEVTNVRIKRLHEITAEDCIAEGLRTNLREHDATMHLREQFERLWLSTGGDWDGNPWVWVIEFERAGP